MLQCSWVSGCQPCQWLAAVWWHCLCGLLVLDSFNAIRGARWGCITSLPDMHAMG